VMALLARAYPMVSCFSRPRQRRSKTAPPRPRPPPPRWRRPPEGATSSAITLTRCTTRARPRTPSTTPKRSHHRPPRSPRRPSQRGRRPLQWLGGGNHRGRAEAARRRITVEQEHIDLSLLALVRAERTAWAVPTPAAERAANLKGPGLSTARSGAIHHHHSVVIGSPPPEDKDGVDLWAASAG